MKSRPASLLVAALSGVAVAAAFPPWNVWLAAVAGLAALAWSWRHGAWFNFLAGLVHGTVFFLIHLTWAYHSVGVIPWVALSITEAIFIGLAGAIWAITKRGRLFTSPAAQAGAFALLWTAAEEARSRFPFGGFPWGRIAFSQTDGPVARLAWLGGAPLVSLTIALAAALVWVAFTQQRFSQGLVPLVAAIGVIGVGLIVPISGGNTDERFTIGAVQGNVPDLGLDAFNQAREVLNNHLAGTWQLEPYTGRLDLIVWPENGSDVNPEHDAEAGAQVDELAQALQAPILIGTLEYPETGGRYNRAMLWLGGVGVIDTYDKQRPAAFAEYIPMRSIARIFSPDVDRVTTDMIAGTEVATIQVPSERLERLVTFSDIICFEIAYDAIVRTSVTSGGEFIVVQTNNASFGRTPESLQQLAISRLRAIEFGRYTIQISTVGVSGTIAPNGAILNTTEHFEPAQFVQTVGLQHTLTPAARFGSYLAWSIIVSGPLVLGLGLMGREKSRTTRTSRATRTTRRR